jgi:hypothetical protein
MNRWHVSWGWPVPAPLLIVVQVGPSRPPHSALRSCGDRGDDRPAPR